MLSNQISYFDRLAASSEAVKSAYGDDLNESDVAYRMHEANVCSFLFRWNWEYIRVQEGIYGVIDIPVDGFRWQYKTTGIDKHWEEKKAWFDPGFVKFMETDIIPHAPEPKINKP